MPQPISTPMLIPKDILSEQEQKLYEQFKGNAPELEKRFKWWSMHDLMKYFHSGLMTKENDANMFSFQIDLTAPELEANAARNPQLLSSLNTAMSNLSVITNEISADFSALQSETSNKLTQTVLDATSRKSGGNWKKSKKGGAPNFAEKFSADRLKKECLNDLKTDTFGSRDRIFVVDGLLPLASEELKNQIAAPVVAQPPAVVPGAPLLPGAPPLPGAPAAAPGAAGPAAAAAPGMGGGRRKTRKGRKHGKKRKTHRRRH